MKTVIKQINNTTLRVRRMRNSLFSYNSDFPCIYCTSKTYAKQIKRALRSMGIVYHQQYRTDKGSFVFDCAIPNIKRTSKFFIEARVFCKSDDCLEYIYIEKCTDWDIELYYNL